MRKLRNKNDYSPPLLEKFLINGCKLLQSSKSDFIAIPCNSVHKYIDDMRKSLKIPILSIIEETAKELKRKKISRALILGTNYTIQNKIYDSVLLKKNIQSIIPDDNQQKNITKIIINVLKGKKSQKDKEGLLNIIKSLNSDGVVLGCTELPLVISNEDIDIPLFDTLEILAFSSFNFSVGK